MKDYLFIYRNDYSVLPQPTPEQAQAEMKMWMDWLGGIAAQNKLTAAGNPLTSSGKVVKANNIITNGPYSEIKEVVGGYSVIKAASFEEAADMAKGCPVLRSGGNVEVREVVPM
ncbi:MAG: YciI family protein [Ferruginibacter sp.]